MRRYVHIGTGNYNPKTARIYTDFGILSADPNLGADLTDLFNVLTGFASPAGYRKLIIAPRGHAGPLPRDDPAGDRARARRAARADHGQDERPGGPGHHLGAVRGVPGRRADRPDRARHLLPPAGTVRHQRHDPGHQHRRPLPRAFPRLLLPQRRAPRRSTSAPPTGCRATSTAGSRPWPRSTILHTGRRSATCCSSCWQDNRQAWDLHAGRHLRATSALQPARASGRRIGCWWRRCGRPFRPRTEGRPSRRTS